MSTGANTPNDSFARERTRQTTGAGTPHRDSIAVFIDKEFIVMRWRPPRRQARPLSARRHRFAAAAAAYREVGTQEPTGAAGKAHSAGRRVFADSGNRKLAFSEPRTNSTVHFSLLRRPFLMA